MSDFSNERELYDENIRLRSALKKAHGALKSLKEDADLYLSLTSDATSTYAMGRADTYEWVELHCSTFLSEIEAEVPEIKETK